MSSKDDNMYKFPKDYVNMVCESDETYLDINFLADMILWMQIQNWKK